MCSGRRGGADGGVRVGEAAGRREELIVRVIKLPFHPFNLSNHAVYNSSFIPLVLSFSLFPQYSPGNLYA